MPRIARALAPSPGQAQYVLDRLLADRRITVADVQAYLRDLEREILELELRIRTLRDIAGTGSRPLVASPATPQVRVRRRRKYSAAGRRGLRFSGLIRHMPAKVKHELTALRAAQGIDAAIAAAEAVGRR